jgi:hypothetical protein
VHVRRDRVVALAGIGCEEDLRSLDLPRRVLALGEQRLQCVALVIRQLHDVAYVHERRRSQRRLAVDPEAIV